MKLVLARNPIELLPERAVWWPARRTAVVADVHLGKDQVFRRSGIAIPAGVLDAELGALDQLITATRCERLLVLGDWVHAPPAEGEAWPEKIARWRRGHRQLTIDLVPGNHDRNLLAWLREWSITAHADTLKINDLSFFHEVDYEESVSGMSGHLHPVAWLRSGRERLRLPAFARKGNHLILPAFGRFTGGFDGLYGREWQLLAVLPDRVIPVP